MRIAIIAHSLYPIKEPYAGGLEMITYLLCKALKNRGHEIDLYAHRDSTKDVNLIPIDIDFSSSLDGKRGNDLDNDKNTYINYTKLLFHLREMPYDIIHNHSLHHQPIILGNLMDKPFITSFHTPPFPNLKMALMAMRYNQHQQFTFVSESLQKNWNTLVEDSEVIYNGINLQEWPYSDSSNNYLFWYGRICPEKAPHLAMKAAIEANETLYMAGPISNQEYYDDEVEQLLQHEKIEYKGHLSQREISSVLRKAKAMICTSTWEEPYGLIYSESLASGTPVISHDVGAASEILTSQTSILTSPGNTAELVEAITKSKRLKRGACRKRAEAFCSYTTMVDGYEQLYEKLLKAPAKAKKQFKGVSI
ncbi:glycosyltransferase [Flavobacteriaceae bacterium TK19130]|nr:glycosyltransferase [Thermobacterium salinum]